MTTTMPPAQQDYLTPPLFGTPLHVYRCGGVECIAPSLKVARTYLHRLLGKSFVGAEKPQVVKVPGDELIGMTYLHGTDEPEGETFSPVSSLIKELMVEGDTAPQWIYHGTWLPDYQDDTPCWRPRWISTAKNAVMPASLDTVWISDGTTVRMGHWVREGLGEAATTGLWETGHWVDVSGRRAEVTHWRWVDESDLEPPPLPAECRLPWVDCSSGECTPRSGTTVWTTAAGDEVREGVFHLHKPVQVNSRGWPRGEWKTIHGEPLQVTHWREVDHIGEKPPQPPQ